MLGLALGVLAGCSPAAQPVTPPRAPAGSAVSPLEVPGAGLTGPVGPVARSCQGVVITTANDVQKIIGNHPPGTTFCLSAGTYRLPTPLVPKRGDELIGKLGAVLSGSEVLTGWQRNGNGWSAPGFLSAAPSTDGECIASMPTCTYAQDVFFDQQRLRRVSSLSAVTAGTVYANYQTDVVTIGDDPQSHLVEQAVAPSLIDATVDDVTVANLVLEEAANQAQVGVVEDRGPTPPVGSGTGWQILHDDIRLNHGVGIGFASASTIADNFIHNQGQLGFGSAGSGSVVTNNEISFNGAAGYSSTWEAGGGKNWMVDDETFTHNYVHDNMGPGFWDDGGSVNTTYEYNKIVDNWGAGIQHEISYDAIIEHNEISGNGFQVHMGWAWDAGIQIQSSGGAKLIDVAYNAVVNNYNGITVLDSGDRVKDQPAPHGPHIVENVWVHNNTITMSGSQTTGAVEDDGHRAIFTANHNRFEANTYYVDSLIIQHFSWASGNVDWSRWLRYGNDRAGRALLFYGSVGYPAPDDPPTGLLPYPRFAVARDGASLAALQPVVGLPAARGLHAPGGARTPRLERVRRTTC